MSFLCLIVITGWKEVITCSSYICLLFRLCGHLSHNESQISIRWFNVYAKAKSEQNPTEICHITEPVEYFTRDQIYYFLYVDCLSISCLRTKHAYI